MIGNALYSTILIVTYRIIDLYIWILIVGAVMSWLVAYNVINARNRFVQVVGDFIYRITEPLLKPIRKKLPAIGGMDISPLVLIFILWIMEVFISRLAY